MSSRRMWVALASLSLPLTILPAAMAGASTSAAANAGDVIPGQYIVTTANDGARSTADAVADVSRQARSMGVTVTREFSAMGSFVARMNESEAQALRNQPGVMAVEPDRMVKVAADQSGATWGIDRIDQRDLPLNQRYTSSNDGEGVNAYIIDTGINSKHSEFTGRIDQGYDAYDGDSNPEDCAGHGTHVAGTVAGTKYGVAKKARITAVRVLGCDGTGSNSGVIAGMDWVTKNARKPAVANMSLGGGASTAEDQAVRRMTQSGVVLAVAAGNDGANACNYSPARASEAITVGWTGSNDAKSGYSNYGTCLDIFAPGGNITSAWTGSSTSTSTISGTSMASPHVAGVAALYLAANPTASVAEVTAAIVNNSTPNKVTSAGSGSPNKLLFSGFINGGGTPGPGPDPIPDPTPDPTDPCGKLVDTRALNSGYAYNTASFTLDATTKVTGCLTGTARDYDLYLQKQSGSSWSTVSKSVSSKSEEKIEASLGAGTYRWRVYAYSGSGTFELKHTN